jgi:hypothetical protein
MGNLWWKDAGWGWVRCYEPIEVNYGRMVLKVYRSAHDRRTYVANIECDLPGVYLPSSIPTIRFKFRTKHEATAWGLKQWPAALREAKRALAAQGYLDHNCQYVEIDPDAE